MNTNQWIKKLNKIVKQSYYGEKKQNMYLPEVDSERGYGWERAEGNALKLLSGEDEHQLIGFTLEQFHDYHQDYFYYYMLTFGNISDSAKEFARSSAYAYFTSAFDHSFNCIGKLNTTDIKLLMFRLHLFIRASWWEESEALTTWVMKDILTKDEEKMIFVSPSGIGIYRMSWFILTLAAKTFGHELDESYYPDLEKAKAQDDPEWSIYQEVIAHWDTPDIKEVDKYVALLCDLLVMDNAKGEMRGDQPYETVIVGAYLYPYPVLTWLKLRERYGLENPKEYSHELMQHPLATRFDHDLERPQDLPYVQELSEYVRAKEPGLVFPVSFME